VRKKIRALPDKPSMGVDDIRYGVVKRLEPFLTGPIRKIINATSDHHPKSEKVAAVKPLYKGSPKDLDDPKSYRSVSLLPVIGRIDESLKADQMKEYSESL
jgi:hypothetical protein